MERPFPGLADSGLALELRDTGAPGSAYMAAFGGLTIFKACSPLVSHKCLTVHQGPWLTLFPSAFGSQAVHKKRAVRLRSICRIGGRMYRIQISDECSEHFEWKLCLKVHLPVHLHL